MVLCDTDFIIAFLRSDPHAIEKLEQLVEKEVALFTTHLNVCELFKGAYRTSKPRKAITTIHEILTYFEILPFSIEADEHAGHIIARLHKKGTPIGDIDAIIASIAHVYHETVLTNNVQHFERTNVPIETWS